MKPPGVVTSIVYVSSAVSLFSSEDLRNLLSLARDNNARLGITGMLLYKGGNFMQALEGPEEAVREKYSTIARDPRHVGVLKLLDYVAPEREFASWTMGFTNLDGIRPPEGSGYSEVMNQPLNSEWFRNDPSRAQKLLLSFLKNM